jgi:hypothetical protein
MRVEQNTTGQGDEETHVLRRIAHALRPPETVHFDHTVTSLSMLLGLYDIIHPPVPLASPFSGH